MTAPQLVATQLTEPGPADDLRPLLIVGPSIGTSARTLWSRCAALLADDFHVIGWDLPGHGSSAAPARPGSLTMADLAEAVLGVADRVQGERGDGSTPFAYAGDSVGGAVGLQLLLDAPERVSSAVLLCTSAKFGEPGPWLERAATVRASGTPSILTLSAQRWFPEGFLEREPEVGAALLHALQDADSEGYARVCEALAAFDVVDRLPEITAPVLAVAGAVDVATPPESLRAIADGVQDGRLEVIDGMAHLAPAERPAEVAALIRTHVGSADAWRQTRREVYDAGMSVRRAVLGDAHVDRAVAGTTGFTQDFQDLITQYAWGAIWTRPGLDRRSRSMITLTALIARGHHEELAMHVRAARTNGLTDEEIKEVILQSAIYCGVPDANTAFRIAQQTLTELDAAATDPA